MLTSPALLESARKASSGVPLKGDFERMARRRYQRGSLSLVGGRQKKWQARWREDVVNSDGSVGRVPRKEIIGTQKELPTRRLAEREMERYVAPVNRLDYKPKRICTFAEFAELWRTRVASQYKPSTRAAAEMHLRAHLLPKFGKKIVGEIDSWDVQDFISGIKVRASKTAKPTMPASGKTVKNLISTLSVMRKVAVAWNLTDRDWFTGVVLPEWVKPEVRPLALDEAKLVINSAAEPHKTFYWLLAETGIRLGEACALRPEDFRLELQAFVIRWSTWRSIHVGTTKAKKARRVDLSPELTEHMRALIAQRKRGEFLFHRKDGTPWQGDHVVRDYLKPLLKRLGIDGVGGAHAFRHMNASMMDQLRAPDKVRQERLGHIDFNDMTINVYSHSDQKDHKSVAAQLGGLLAPKSLAEMPTQEGAVQ